MNFHNTTQAYARPVAKMPLHQLIGSHEIDRLQGKVAGLLKETGKVVLFTVALVVVINFTIISGISNIERSIVSLENSRHELTDINIGHRAIKAELSNPVNMEKLADDKLSLYAATEKQVGVFDRKFGTFKPGQFDRETKTFVRL